MADHCTHHMGTIGQPCPWDSRHIVTEGEAVPHRHADGHRGEVAGGALTPEAAPRTIATGVVGLSAPVAPTAGSASTPATLAPTSLGRGITPDQRPTMTPTLPLSLSGVSADREAAAVPSPPCVHSRQVTLDGIDATPRARATDPDTAHRAAGVQTARLTSDMRLVLAAHVAAGERGITGPELAAATRRTYEQVGPRRKPLEVAELVERVERRPKDPTQPNGSLVWAYRATALGREVYANELARSAA